MKKLLISLGAISSFVAISATSVSCGKNNSKKPSNVNENKAEERDLLLNLTAKNVLEVGIPKFAEDALNALMEKVFTARAKGIYQTLSNDVLNKDKILDEVSKTAFEDIYNINLDIKSKFGEISFSLGDLLLEFLNNEDPTKTPLSKVLFDGDYTSLGTPISAIFANGNPTIGPDIASSLVSKIMPLMGNEKELAKFSSALSGILPSGLSISLGDNLILTGLVDKIQDRIIKDFDKISEMQGKTFAEIADNQIYRRVATAIFGMKYSGKILEKDVPADALEALKIVYKATNNQEISKEEFISAFSNQGLLSFLEQKEGVKIFDLVSTINLNGKSVSELLGNLIGSYVDISHLNIPELQWGRGAGQLGANEQKLATKISQLIAYKGSELADLFGYKEKTQAEIDELNNIWKAKNAVYREAISSGMREESEAYNIILNRKNVIEKAIKTAEESIDKEGKSIKTIMTEITTLEKAKEALKEAESLDMDKVSQIYAKLATNEDADHQAVIVAQKDIVEHKGIISIFSIIGLYAMPQVNGVYTTPSLNSEQTTELVTKLYNNYLNTLGYDIGFIMGQQNDENITITELTADKLFQDKGILFPTILTVLSSAFGSLM